MIEIQSPQNPRVKAAAKLRTARGRQQQGRILIEGARELRCALRANIEVVEVFFDDEALKQPDASEAWDMLDPSTERLRVAPNVWPKLSVRETYARLVATAKPPNVELSRIQLGDQPLLLVLDSIEKPGNLGALFRTANAVGVDAVILSNPVCDIFNPNAIRSSLGAVFNTTSGAASQADVLNFLHENSVRCVASRVDANVAHWDADLMGSVALVMGSEAQGLSDAWRHCEGVQLPMRGEVDSLNVSVAAAALMYEAARQRRPPLPTRPQTQ